MKQPLSIVAVVCLAGGIFSCAVLRAASETKPGFDADHPKSGAPIAAEKLRRLAWSPPATNGLRAACYFDPTKDSYADGEVVKRWKVFHNSGKEPVLFTVGGGDYRWTVVDEQDRKVPLDQVAHYGKLQPVTFRLEPGHAAEIACSSVGLGASTKAGGLTDTAIQAKPGTTCRVRWMLQVAETTRLENGRLMPVAGAWHGELTTGEVRFRIVKQGAASKGATGKAVGQIKAPEDGGCWLCGSAADGGGSTSSAGRARECAVCPNASGDHTKERYKM